jgi:hypothetical protein
MIGENRLGQTEKSKMNKFSNAIRENLKRIKLKDAI